MGILCSSSGLERNAEVSPGGRSSVGGKRRAYDFWEAELDRGHVRKTKAVREANKKAKQEAAHRFLRGSGAHKPGSGKRAGSKPLAGLRGAIGKLHGKVKQGKVHPKGGRPGRA